jgi:hypothetical protein
VGVAVAVLGFHPIVSKRPSSMRERSVGVLASSFVNLQMNTNWRRLGRGLFAHLFLLLSLHVSCRLRLGDGRTHVFGPNGNFNDDENNWKRDTSE